MNKKLVLVIEDQPSIREMIVDSLEVLGYSTLEAKGMESALKIAQAHKGSIQTVICDMILGFHRGTEIVSELKKCIPHFAVIYMSGYRKEDLMSKTSEEENEIFLSKPFSIETLEKAMAKARQAVKII